MENNITLYGASGHAKVVVDIIMSNGKMVKKIIDDYPKLSYINDICVEKTSENYFQELHQKPLIITIGDNKTRKKIALKLDAKYETAIHKASIISTSSSIKKGTVVMPGAVINASAVVGQHCIVNTNAVIEHDCVIDDFVHVSPNASLAGNVVVGEGTHIGIGACIIQGVNIGKWVTVGAGSVVLKDVPDYAVIVGNPAKIIKYNNND